MRYIGYNKREFQKLKAGDVVVYMVGLKKQRTVCTGNAFYNNDADEPGWEVETENTFLSVDNDIWVQAHDEKENDHAAGFKERISFEEAKLRTDISVRRVSISYEGYHQFLNVMEDAPEEADIAKIMTISTAHIKSDTILRSHNSNVTIFSKGMYGWFVYVPEYDIRECGTCPNELLDVLDYAREEGCTWLLLDSDGPIINELPTYEWTAPIKHRRGGTV